MESQKEGSDFSQDDFVEKLLSGEYRMRFNESLQLEMTWHPDDTTLETKEFVLGEVPNDDEIFGEGKEEYIECVKQCVGLGGDQIFCAIICAWKLK